MIDQRGRTSLTRFAAAMRDPDPEGPRRAARDLWHRSGVIVIFPDDNLPGLARMAVEGIAITRYGKRGDGRA